MCAARFRRVSYYMALILNYPNSVDAARGLKENLISKEDSSAIVGASERKKCPPFGTRLGGEIEIHGMGAGTDWTWGCVALESIDIKELYERVPVGTPVTIKP